MSQKNIDSYFKTRFAYFLYSLLRRPVVNTYLELKRRRRLIDQNVCRFEELREQGYTIVANYLSAKDCDHAVANLKKAFEKYTSYDHETEDRRIFGIEQTLPVARKLAQEIDFLELGELVNREYTYCAFTLAGWLQAGHGGSSGNGWHRDAFFSQFKAMVYLTDVTMDNGPFELLPGSHKLSSVLSGISKAGIGHNQNRLSDEEVSRLEEVLGTPRKTLIGNAGDLILFNSSTVHRGRPIDSGERFALTNYYFPISRDPRSVFEQFSPLLTAADVF